MDLLRPSEELAARVAEGDEYAFQILVNRHQTPVLNLIYRFLGDRQKSEDLAQETFFQVWRSAKTYKGKSKFTTWLYRICINICLNEIKSARRKKWLQFFQDLRDSNEPPDDSLLDDAPNAEDLLLARERSRQVSNALHALPENQRIALILKRHEDLSYEEISSVLGCSIASANIYLPLSEAQALINQGPGAVNVVFLRLKSPSLFGQVKADILKKLKGVSVTSSDSFMELMGGVSKIP